MISTSLCFLLLLSQCTAVEHNLINPDQSVLLLSTLNGSLIAVDKLTGVEMWTLDKDPILDVSSVDSMEFNFFPNPKDGSIYALRDGDQLERLALSIPNLVEISPTQSSDGLLYAGRKSDSWFAVDSLTGRQLHSFTSDGVATTCPLPESRGNVIHIARTAYTITVHDRKSSSQRWNATYMEYASSSYKEPAESDLLHFCSNSDGSVLSVDRLTGQEVWRHQYSSPVMGVYAVEDGSLRKVPSTSVASDTLSMLTGSSVLAIRTDTFGIKASDSALQLSLFIGMYQGQLYAVNSLVKDTDLKLEINSPLLLEGPQASNPERKAVRGSDEDKSPPREVPQFLEAGHYCLPQEGEVTFTPMQIEKEFLALFQGKTSDPDVGEQLTEEEDGYSSPTVEGWSRLPPPQPPSPADYNMPSGRMENILVPILTVLTSAVLASVIAVLVTRFSSKQPQLVVSADGSSHLSTDLSTSSSLGGSVDGGSRSGGARTVTVETPSSTTTTVGKGEVTIGKITYYSGEILGYGSEGTIVFKGKFDERPVAVKRLLPECFGFADREVNLLRQSDKHANVVRYYSMEQDSSFRYIALELCQATLQEYVEDKENRFGQSKKMSLDILHQALKGLAYLHSIGIVHRDIKPHNVLLSSTTLNGSIRAMISDFGLCKKLAHGKVSFTARSGLTGTEGWMAPEILQKNGRVTFAVDIFSMGCVVYYMLTGGNHPFGPPLRRQANIESDDYSLQALTGVVAYAHGNPFQLLMTLYHIVINPLADQCVASELLKNMISHNSNFRPRAEEVLVHCLFWSEERQLAFFQDVSDRIEKESYMSPVVQALELGASNVCRGDWRNNISDELKEDLRKFRSYQGSSVRDLLRAMRNKKHHYRELPEELKQSLGSIPDEFLHYFTSRFPMLLIHTYRKMEMCKHERVFKKYYSNEI